MFFVKNPSALGKPWILSKKGDQNEVSIPVEVTKLLKNYQIMAIEFLYHNYRKGVKGAILNQQRGMNFPLQISAFLRAVVKVPVVVLVICHRQISHVWYYHLVNHADFEVILVTNNNAMTCHGDGKKKVALLLNVDELNLSEDFDTEFFSVIVDHLDEIARKRAVKSMISKFNIGLTYRSFYVQPDQTLQWNMLNWAVPGCVGKLKEFYELDNRNFENFEDNYRYWWHRLTWQFCESFEKPTDDELDNYEKAVLDWSAQNSQGFTERKIKSRERRNVSLKKSKSNSNDSTTSSVPIDKYVKLPSMDENPILSSIIKNFEVCPEPILSHESLPAVKIQPGCSKYEQNSIILSLMEEKPSTSKSDSENFILNLI